MSTHRRTVEDAISNFRTIVAADGGDIRFESYDPGAATVTVAYKVGTNEECPGCVITPDELSIFIKEAVASRGLPVDEVTVNAR